MKTVRVEEAVGLILCHDITEIIPGVKKGTAFRKGHRVTQEDIEVLKRIGKEHLYVWSEDAGMVHEDDAAQRIAAVICGEGITCSKPVEGRINFTAATQGLFRMDINLLNRLNSIEYVTIATAPSMQEVKPGRMIAGTRVVPLAVPETTLRSVEEVCAVAGPLLTILPFKKCKVGIVTTGTEVYSGRIKDGFGPVLRAKIEAWGSEVVSHTFVPDGIEVTAKAIMEAIENGADMITVTGGMSVDPDDKTPAAIRAVGCEVVTYGAPVFPGAMFMLGYKGNIPIFGLPGCVMYNRASIFDLVAPRILAGLRVTKHDIISFAHGGLCENCPECHYPVCSFGK